MGVPPSVLPHSARIPLTLLPHTHSHTHTRTHLPSQGSTNLEHWSINVNFEPVLFEDPALGVRVHRGVYEAALRIYDDLAPLVREMGEMLCGLER
jgi:hypothetical protein